MRDPVTVLRPDARASDARSLASALPPDLVDAVRGRVRLLALFLLAAFAFDPVLSLVTWILFALRGGAPGAAFFAALPFRWVELAVAAASAGLWWEAGKGRVSPSKLHAIGLAYEIGICAVTATLTCWQFYLDHGLLPNLTWVPVIIVLFPLIMPGPPRRMLAAAIAAGATTPLAILVLDLSGRVTAGAEAYVSASVSSAFAVGFAYLGARVIYGLGRQVATARELGSYRLEERIGRGGMGEVWRARHRMLARPAAIKVIRTVPAADAHPGWLEDRRRRFEREAQITASLRSPHTVELYDFGIADDGSFYYVMELLDGLDADTLVRRFGPLPAERVVHVLLQICHSLSEAHARGLVHRDIKPANVFLCRYGEQHDFVKVLDFGLAKALGDAGADAEPALSGEGALRGTPAFIAPEQALGRPGLDGRVDIYATGCVAYWLLTGQLVFTADTPMGILLQHVKEPPPAPSSRTEMPLPPALDRLVLECLEKEPAARPASARELARRLEEAAATGSTRWTEETAREWWAKHQPGERTKTP